MIPKNEFGVREDFAVKAKDLGYTIVASRGAFPDMILQKSDGEMILAEVEYKSRSFISHGHESTGCDVVICWEHDARLDVMVMELSTGAVYSPGVVPDKIKRPATEKYQPGQMEIAVAEIVARQPDLNDLFLATALQEGDARIALLKYERCLEGPSRELVARLDIDVKNLPFVMYAWLKLYNRRKLNITRLNDEPDDSEA